MKIFSSVISKYRMRGRGFGCGEQFLFRFLCVAFSRIKEVWRTSEYTAERRVTCFCVVVHRGAKCIE